MNKKVKKVGIPELRPRNHVARNPLLKKSHAHVEKRRNQDTGRSENKRAVKRELENLT